MVNDSIFSLTAAGVVKITTPQGEACVRLGRVGLQILESMLRAIAGNATAKDLQLAQWARGVPVESWPPVAKRAQPTVQAGLPRGAP